MIVLTPDHFNAAAGPFATTRLNFDTALGPVEIDAQAVDHLLQSDSSVEASCLFSREHGLRALLPFVRHYMPDARLVPIAISQKAKRADWDRLAHLLEAIADEHTLVVQSTDFSHYHPAERSRLFDQQTLNTIAAGSLDQLAALTPSDHLDSVGGLYTQMKLQSARHGAKPVVIASGNQQAYSPRRLEETTGYIVMLFARWPDDVAEHDPDADLIYFAGDTLFGRAMVPALSDVDRAARVREAVLSRTKGRPLIVNLEGVILPNVPEALGPMMLGMPEALTIEWLKALNVVAVGLANNHTMDLGLSGLAETHLALYAAGIPHFGQSKRLDIGRLTLVGLTDLDSNGPPYVDLIDDDLLDRLIITDATRPVVALAHWGREYATEPAQREIDLAEDMRLRGASLIVGAHPHVADGKLTALGSGETLLAYSLGNFLFDQTSQTSSGALLELRVFEQGTYFARLLPLPNLFDLAKAR